MNTELKERKQEKFLNKIFSAQNIYNDNEYGIITSAYKQIILLGIKIKIKIKFSKLENNLINQLNLVHNKLNKLKTIGLSPFVTPKDAIIKFSMLPSINKPINCLNSPAIIITYSSLGACLPSTPFLVSPLTESIIAWRPKTKIASPPMNSMKGA